MDYLGIDGCKAGWFYVGKRASGAYVFGIMETMDQLESLATPQTRICIDMPMGLWEKNPSERPCDLAARKLLKGRGSSIFPTPARGALGLSDYRAASELNFQLTGRRLSLQSFYIMPKIKEVDDFISRSQGCYQLHECHPELSFLALNQFVHLTHSKKTALGRDERLALLGKHLSGFRKVFEDASRQYLRKELALDDILDAGVLAHVASLGEGINRLPGTAVRDDRGIKMEIVYPG
ncbi:MAG: DUF429 domain-containing protein [Desulfobacterales bacterium]|nr:DUF429 domain-containing protein [Desulfobacterales bacterium]